MLKQMIERWSGFSPGQKRTVLLASFFSPMLSIAVIFIQKLLAPEVETVFGYKEAIIIGYVLSLSPVLVVATLSKIKNRN